MDNSRKKKSLLNYITNSNYIEIIFEAETINCIPLIISEKLLLVLRYFDFLPYGYEIIPIERIVSTKYSESNKYFESIVKNEGAEIIINNVPNISILDLNTVFAFFLDSGEIVILDIGKENCINIGKVNDVSNDEVRMHCFSQTGVWDDEDWIEPFENITSIQFRNHYTEIFSKYLGKEDT